MESEWSVVQLSEVAALTSGKRPIVVKKDYSSAYPVPVIGGGGRSGFTSHALYDGEILITGRVGTLGKLFALNGPCWPSDNALVIQPKSDGISHVFLRYALQMVIAEAVGMNRGAANPLITQTDLGRLLIHHPPLSEQRTIAHILGTLDDKIELNRKMNETLEAIAQAIFKSWFVDFDPVKAKAEAREPEGMDAETAALFPSEFEESELGLIPKGWRVSCIGEVAEVIDCLHSKKPVRQDAGLPLLQLTNIRDNGLIDMQDTYYISEVDYLKWISRLEASQGDCVITNVGRVGAVAQMPSGQKAALGRNMTGIRCKCAFPFQTFLIECLLSQAMKDEITQKMDTGTILNALNVRNIPKLRFTLPSMQLLQHSENIMRPIRAQMAQRLAESSTLASLRDTLLPRLMSGKLRVPEAEKQLEEVM